MPAAGTDSRLLVVFFGMTAAGKSYLARCFAARNDCPWYNTDKVRKELAGLAANSRQSAGADQGIYSAAYTRKTYDELARRAQMAFASGKHRTVVLDGSYGTASERAGIVERFSAEVRICFIYCYCGENTVRQRLKLRAGDPEAVSDGRWEIYQLQLQRFDVPDRIPGARLLKLNTEQSPDQLMEKIETFLSSCQSGGDRSGPAAAGG